MSRNLGRPQPSKPRMQAAPDWRRGIRNSSMKGMSMPEQYRYAQDYNSMQTEGRANYIRQGYTDMLKGAGQAYAGRAQEINEQGLHSQGKIQQDMVGRGLTGSTAGLASKGLAQRETAFAQNQLTREKARHIDSINQRRLQFEEDIENTPPDLQNMAMLGQLEGQYGAADARRAHNRYRNSFSQVPGGVPGHLYRKVPGKGNFRGDRYEYARANQTVGRGGPGWWHSPQTGVRALPVIPAMS